jgi:SAM-dependent methyltransferase
VVNEYSSRWFSLFMASIDPAQTKREVEFLRRVLPLPKHQRVLDLCCGTGRHAIRLASLGYDVVGIDADAAAIGAARSNTASARFDVGDVRDLSTLDGPFDAAMILWQSFGFFEAETNARLLRDLRSLLVPEGRLILDIYNRDYFATRLAIRTFERDGVTVTESKSLDGGRLRVRLDYGDSFDAFDWQVFAPESIRTFANVCGFDLVFACTGFDESSSPSSESPRMQLAFECVQ